MVDRVFGSPSSDAGFEEKLNSLWHMPAWPPFLGELIFGLQIGNAAGLSPVSEACLVEGLIATTLCVVAEVQASGWAS